MLSGVQSNPYGTKAGGRVTLRTVLIATISALPILMIGCVVKWDILVPLARLLN